MADINNNHTGATKLRAWWKDVRDNLNKINAQIVNHIAGTADRHTADQVDYSGSQTVKAKIDTESAARQQGDTTLQTNINTEAQARKNADDTLRADLEAEEIARTDTDTELSGRLGDLSKLETIRKGNLVSAVNENKAVLDMTRQETAEIRDMADTALAAANTAQESADSVVGTAQEALQSAAAASENVNHHLSDQNNPHSVTKDQVGLGQVENVRQASKTEFDTQATYTDNMIAGMVLDVRQLYIMLGVNLIDGGLFHEPQDGVALDGGDFESEPTGVFDCGDFNPPAILPIGDTVDGGNF